MKKEMTQKIIDTPAYSLEVSAKDCVIDDLYHMQFVCGIKRDGDIEMKSTYEYFLTSEQIALLSNSLLKFLDE